MSQRQELFTISKDNLNALAKQMSDRWRFERMTLALFAIQP